MRNLLPALCIIALCSTTAAFAQADRGDTERAAELAVSNQAIQLRYLDDAEVIGRADNDVMYGFLLSEDRDVVGSAALFIDTDIQLMPRLSIQVGPQVYAALLSNDENDDVLAMSFGLRARYELHRSRGIAIVGHAFYSPDVLTFGSGDNLKDLEARAEMRVTQGIIGFAGYRWFDINLVGLDERDVQNQFFAGIRVPLR
jgi:hypothetical protein